MDLSISRRTFLGGTAAGVGFAFAGDGSLDVFARPAPRPPAPPAGYGPLLPDPNPTKLMALPEGFSYKIVAQSGVTPVRNGVFPSDPDGMAVFRRRRGGSILVCNHEIAATERYPVTASSALTYDVGAIGGTSTIHVDRDGNRLDAYASLAGTDNNCAGGITPWRTWLTCEEVERVAGQSVSGRTLQKNHGYVFEVDPRSETANLDRAAIPLKFMGRFAHEAVAVDPDRHVVYLTEDAGSARGLYFRWKPPRGFAGGKRALHELALSTNGDTAGRLQAMSCSLDGVHIEDLSEATDVGTAYEVAWVDVVDREGIPVRIRDQFADDQITRSRKLEGQWWGDDGAYFVSSFARTTDGSTHPHDGQVWFYNPRRKTVTLKTRFGVNPTPRVEDVPDGPDNITVSPHGGLILAEDGSGIQHLIGVSTDGTAYPLARNEIRQRSGNDSEFCGPTFSADGRVLFVNMYSPGYTFAITGPWRQGRR